MIVERVKRTIARFDNPLLDTSLSDDIKLILRETVGLPLQPARTPVPGDQGALVPDRSSDDSEAGSEQKGAPSRD